MEGKQRPQVPGGTWSDDGRSYTFDEEQRHLTADESGLSEHPLKTIDFGDTIDGMPDAMIIAVIKSFSTGGELSYQHICDDECDHASFGDN